MPNPSEPTGPAQAGVGEDALPGAAGGPAVEPGAAGAAPSSPASTDQVAVTRRRRKRRRPTVPDLVAGTIFAIAGALFIASATTSQDGAIRVDSTGGLRDAIAARAENNVELQAEVDELSAQVLALQKESDPGPALAQTQEEIATLAPVVGLTEVIGPGVSVSLDDATAPDPLPDGMTGDDYLVHQQDVQGVVNALWRGGASGVTVMGQRLISTSAVRCVGNTVILQGRVYSPPFVIHSVGDVRSLEAALAEDPSVQFFRDWARVVGLRYEQRTARALVLPAYSGPLAPKYAQVVS